MRTRRLCAVAGTLPLFLAVVARAQFTADYQTNIISGVVSNWSGEYLVGSNTFADALLIQDGGQLSQTDTFGAFGYIGRAVSASNNAVTVNGSGARWSLAVLLVGANGSGNSLTVTNGGRVENYGDGNVGSDVFSVGGSSNNVVTVTGSGSVWSNGHYLLVSNHGRNNRLIINDGGVVYDKAAYIGAVGGDAVTVSDPGSIWDNTAGANPFTSPHGSLFLGYGGGENSLVIRDGGRVVDWSGHVGDLYGASNNRVIVSGVGSVWSNLYDLSIGSNDVSNVGDNYGGNSLVISNGGRVVNASACIGCLSDTNIAVVTGLGSMWNNSARLWVGSGAGNRFIIGDGATVLSQIGLVGGVSNDSVLITGSGSVWSNQGFLTVGYYGHGSSLVISNGGAVVTGNGEIGYGSDSNTATVAGGGASWIVQGSLTVFDGDDYHLGANALVIGSGGITVCSNLVLGCAGGRCDSSITAAGSLFVTNAVHDGTLDLDSGTFTVNGGLVVADKLVITNPCAQFVRNGGTLIYGTAVLATNLDADGDGMANGWEQAYGLDPLNAADASTDNDGDRFTNLQEFQAGTDPTNSASAFRILSVVPTNDDVLVTWSAGGGRTNVVQSAADITGSYTNVGQNIILTNTPGVVTTNYLDTGGATNGAGRFYKIRLVP